MPTQTRTSKRKGRGQTSRRPSAIEQRASRTNGGTSGSGTPPGTQTQPPTGTEELTSEGEGEFDIPGVDERDLVITSLRAEVEASNDHLERQKEVVRALQDEARNWSAAATDREILLNQCTHLD